MNTPAPSSDLKTSVIRTITPFLVGLVATFLAKIGIKIDDAFVTPAITIGVGSAWYAVARWLEINVAPKWGRLLGRVAKVTYQNHG